MYDLSVTHRTRPQCVSSSPASCTVSLCFEVLYHPILPRGAVRCSRSPCIYFPALIELWSSMRRLYQIYWERVSNARGTRPPRVEKMQIGKERALHFLHLHIGSVAVWMFLSGNIQHGSHLGWQEAFALLAAQYLCASIAEGASKTGLQNGCDIRSHAV